MKLANRVAVVTGASTGIGRAISVAIAQRGATVCLVGRSAEGLNDTYARIVNQGGKAHIFNCDLVADSEIQNLATEVLQRFTRVDVLANVAGVWHDNDSLYYGRDLDEIPPEQLENVLRVNLHAPILLSRLFIPDMKRNRSGKILNISGTFAEGGAKWLHYYVSKKAVEHFTLGLADELREYNVQVNCISPSDVATEALKKYFPEDAATGLKPKVVADLAVWLLSSKVAKHITGQVIVMKQETILPTSESVNGESYEK